VIPDSLGEANCSDVVVVKKPNCVLPSFLSFYLNSLAASHVQAGAVGVALTHFDTRAVATMPIPVPPLAEQRRIVAKIVDLKGLTRIEQRRASSRRDTGCTKNALEANRLATAFHLAGKINERLLQQPEARFCRAGSRLADARCE
jgi:type I restriction enzyme S subunit